MEAPRGVAVVVTLGLRARPWATVAWAALGVVLWTCLEHRLHRFFDTMHGDHHQRPWDGMYINGYVILGTRVPPADRRLLYGPRAR